MRRVYIVILANIIVGVCCFIHLDDISTIDGEGTPTRDSQYWEMEIDLSLADASFWGEDSDDFAGRSLSGAGDVNDDGYDDILIGADGDEDGGGAYAGQTYLIFGDDSGWSMDTDLSNADASFWGEDVDDYSGCSVAGVGDINGDGFDDILIGAGGNNEGSGDYPGQTYLIFGRNSGWSMDMDLSKSNASFIGEGSPDTSGASVSGAGDVNKDGYDDFLIGANCNGEGHTRAGQVYLILGRSSGWSMDIDLSKSNASFIGEDFDDYAGTSVSGAGDVNGDGYDDILIGAYGDDDNGGQAGQSYLIFGKASGWSKDTDLSKANASFIGENWGDYSGYCVAGVGDVNGDSYDDFLIGASRNDDGGTDSGQTYLIFGKASGWSMDTDLSNANASFWGEDSDDLSGLFVSGAGDFNGDGYDDFVISAPGDEDGGTNAGQSYLIFGKQSGWSMDTDLSTADASFLGESAGDRITMQVYHGDSVSGTGDVNGDGYDDLLIGSDGDDDGGSNAGQAYLIIGNGNFNIFELDNSFKTATTGENLTFSIEVHEKVNITSVNLEYWYTGISHVKVPMIKVDSFTWNYTIIAPSDLDGNLYYNFSALVNSKYWRNTSLGIISVFDNDKPEFGTEFTDQSAYTGDPFTFSINVTDNIGVDTVNVDYWFGSGEIQSLAMLKMSVELWQNKIDIPSESLEQLHYKYKASDLRNINQSEIRHVSVYDNDRPQFIVDKTLTTADIDEEIKFLVEVRDNIKISMVSVEYCYGEETIQNKSLENADDDEWILRMIVEDTIEPLWYIFHVSDIYENWNETTKRTITVIDGIPPDFVIDKSGSSASTGEDFKFEIEVKDNIGISKVNVKYWGIENNVIEEELSGEVIYMLMIQVPSDWTSLNYYFVVEDTSGNIIRSGTEEIKVIDNDMPKIIKDLTSIRSNMGENITFSVKASDNIGLSSVVIEHWQGDGQHEDLTLEKVGDIYQGKIPTPIDSLEPIFYKIKLTDTSENRIDTNPIEIEIIDMISPTIEPIPDITLYQGEEINITVEAMDNIGVISYHWTGSPLENVSGPTLQGILYEVKKYLIEVEVFDERGNSAFIFFMIDVLPAEQSNDDDDTDDDTDNEFDHDDDGIPDSIELIFGLDPYDSSDADGDLDSDDLTNKEEYLLGTNMSMKDSDGDGLTDGYEVKNGSDPLSPISDTETTDSDESGSNAWISIVIVVVIILVILIMAGVGFLMLKKKGKEETSEKSSEEELPTEEEGPSEEEKQAYEQLYGPN